MATVIPPQTRLTVTVATSGAFRVANATLGKLVGNRWIEVVSAWTDRLPARVNLVRVSSIVFLPAAATPDTATFAVRTSTAGGTRTLAQITEQLRGDSPDGVTVVTITPAVAAGSSGQDAEVATQAQAQQEKDEAERGGVVKTLLGVLGKAGTAALLIGGAIIATVLVVRFAKKKG